jgi:dihydroxyacid dehydratase/phosphogluconate dehydratase
MDARTDIEDRLPGRQVTAGPSRVQHRQHKIFGEIFKETLDVADLKSCGRYVAKDIVEIGGISLLKNTLLDNGQLNGDCITFPGRTNVENLKSARRDPHADSVRPAVVKVAVMSKPRFTGLARCIDRADLFLLPDSDIRGIADPGTLNVKLSDAEPSKRQTKWKAGKTNPTSGALWKNAQQVGPAVDGAVTHLGGAHEKQCYVDI